MRPMYILILVTISPLIGHAADPWIGQRVFYKDGAVAKVGDTVIDIYKINLPATVGDVNGDWLWLERAWVRKADVMSVQAALDYYTEQIRRQPSVASGWNRRGTVWEEKGETDNAIKDYSEAIRLDPTRYSTYNNRGTAWYQKGDYDIAIKDYSEAIRLNPQLAEAYSGRGASRLQKGDLDVAVRDFTESIRLDPQQWYSYHTRGIAFERKGDVDNALKDYTDAIRVNQKASSAYRARANIWRLKHDFDNSITDYSIAIKLDPKSAETYYWRGKVWTTIGNLDNAIKDYKAAVECAPRSSDAYAEIAWLKATSSEDAYRNGKEAVDYATKACELTAWKDRWPLVVLAAAYAESSDFANAVKWQERVVDLAPDEYKPAGRERLDLYKSNQPYRERPKK